MKDILRSRLKNTENSIDKAVLHKKSTAIINRLKAQEIFQKAQNIHCYVSTEFEVNTHELIKSLIKKKNYVIVPYIEHGLKSSYLVNWDDLAIGTFGILEPEIKKNVNNEEIDIIIIPGIAFDVKGYRLGRGKGYYDRFLLKMKAKKIALAFEYQLLPKIPHDKHDIRMDYIITEKRVIKCDISPPIPIQYFVFCMQ
jgi:5-formyltetrahydrofolate cyclo-ligase